MANQAQQWRSVILFTRSLKEKVRSYNPCSFWGLSNVTTGWEGMSWFHKEMHSRAFWGGQCLSIYQSQTDWGLYSVRAALWTLPRPLGRLFLDIHTLGSSCWILVCTHSKKTHLRYHRSPSPNSRPQIPERGQRHRGSFRSNMTVVATTFGMRKKETCQWIRKKKNQTLFQKY